MINISYVPGDSMPKQGKYYEIVKKYGKEWNIKEQGGGNGNWLLTKRSNVLVNGKSCREFVLNYYNRSKLTPNLVEQFRQDVENGKISIDDIFN